MSYCGVSYNNPLLFELDVETTFFRALGRRRLKHKIEKIVKNFFCLLKEVGKIGLTV